MGTLVNDGELNGGRMTGYTNTGSAHSVNDGSFSIGNLECAGSGRCEDFMQAVAKICAHY